jgi:hypothetical protein
MILRVVSLSSVGISGQGRISFAARRWREFTFLNRLSLHQSQMDEAVIEMRFNVGVIEQLSINNRLNARKQKKKKNFFETALHTLSTWECH